MIMRLQNIGSSTQHHLLSQYNSVKQEERTLGSWGEFMSLLCRRKNASIVAATSCCLPEVWLHNMYIDTNETQPSSLVSWNSPSISPQLHKNSLLLLIRTDGFKISFSLVLSLRSNTINLSLSPSNSVSIFWPTSKLGPQPYVLGGDSATVLESCT